MISRVIEKTTNLNKIQKVDQLEGPLYQQENGGHTFEITCMMDNEPASISGAVTARFLRSDEITVFFEGTLSGNVVTVTLPQSCYNVNGRFSLVVFVGGSGITSAVYACAGSVYRTTSDHIIDPTNEIPSLEDLIAQIDACEDATAAANTAAASATAAANAGVRTDTASQGLTDVQKSNARTNIDAASTSDISQLSEEITYESNSGNQTFAFCNGDFKNGGLNTDGTLKPQQAFRVSSNHSMMFDRDITVSAKTGYKWGYIPIVSGSAGAWAGWYTDDKITIAAGTEFVVQIAKATEDQSSTANVEEFVSAIYFATFLSGKVNANKASIDAQEEEISSVNANFDSFADGYSEAIQETVESVGSYTHTLDRVIPKGTSVKIANISTTTSVSINLIAPDGSVVGKGNLLKGETMSFTTTVFVSKITSYVNGTDWNLVISYGYNLNEKIADVNSSVSIINGIENIGQYSAELTNGTPVNGSNAECVRTDYIPVTMNDVVKVYTDRPVDSNADRYIFGVYIYDANKALLQQISPTNRTNETSEFEINYYNAAYIRYAITEIDESDNIVSLRAYMFDGYYCKVSVSKRNLVMSYTYRGAFIETKPKKYAVERTIRSVPSAGTAGASAIQGFAIYNNKIVQCYSGNSRITITDLLTGTVDATLDGYVSHGNSIDFFNEKENSSDYFPYALVADGMSNEAYKIKVETTGITLKETIKFPVAQCGYYVSTALDKLNKIIYTVGYYANSYTDGTGNKMVIGVWDYNNLTTNNDNSVTPAFIKSFYLPFMTTLQGPTFFNGNIYIASSIASQTEADTKIYVVNPAEERIISLFEDFPAAIKNYEMEALYFYEEGDATYCYLRSAYGAAPFYRMVFNG